MVGGAEVEPLRGVGPHSHPLTESSKGGPGRARPPPDCWVALSVGGVRCEGVDRGACRWPGLKGLAKTRIEGLAVGPVRGAWRRYRSP